MFDIYALLFLLFTGLFTGFCAGLFGIGGGGIMVPLLAICFTHLDFPDQHILHFALGTSMAAIIPTSIASIISHQKHRAILWPVVQQLSPGILIGTFTGSIIASYLSISILAVIFSIFMALVAWKMWASSPPNGSRQLPKSPAMMLTGAGIGSISALVAIGGGTMTIPFLLWCNVQLQNAIATSAAVGLPIAITGTLGYAAQTPSSSPAFTIGYVVWPAVLALAAGSICTAPIGARLAHRLPTKKLKQYFAIFLLFLSLQMLAKTLTQ